MLEADLSNAATRRREALGVSWRPHPLLRSPHLQTLLSSRLVRGHDGIGQHLMSSAETVTVPCRDGARLQAVVNAPRGTSRADAWVLLLHGWLGRADSPYVRRASAALHDTGFGVVRLLLRDHGGTAHLNEEMFNAARIGEVVDAANWLAGRYGGDWGMMGFSLGGNFVLRLAAHRETSPRISRALAVCPVLDPAAAVAELDRGWMGYRRYFLGKWRRAFAEKQVAFPDRYDFADAARLSLVGTLTDYFVTRHTPYRDAAEYYRQYTLSRESLRTLRMPARILASEDDPVVPAADVRRLLAAGGADLVVLSRYGGHCGFIEDLKLRSALDGYVREFFAPAC